MKKEYIEATLEIVNFPVTDVIATSWDIDDGKDDENWSDYV